MLLGPASPCIQHFQFIPGMAAAGLICRQNSRHAILFQLVNRHDEQDLEDGLLHVVLASSESQSD